MTRELAILGGTPEFEEPLHVGRPNIPDRETIGKYFNEILDNAWLTNDGPFVRRLEERICEETTASECVAVCNATIGLQLVQRALQLSGQVIVPSFTFVATAHSLQWQGIQPRFADVDRRSHLLDPEKAGERITPDVSALLPVHLWGDVADVDAFESLAARAGVPVVYDSAHALGVSRAGRKVGTFGVAEVFSFHATKLVNSFEGGAVVTNDSSLAQALREMRNFGFAGYDTVTRLGTNAKMSEPSAAMGVASLDELALTIEDNEGVYVAYQRELASIEGIGLREISPDVKSNYQYVVAEVDSSCALSRDEIVAALHAEGVLARRYFYPGCHRMEPYATSMPNESPHLPQTEAVAEAVLVLPTGRAMTPDTARRVVHLIAELLAAAPAIRRHTQISR